MVVPAMKAVLLGGGEEVKEEISLILKMRWPEATVDWIPDMGRSPQDSFDERPGKKDVDILLLDVCDARGLELLGQARCYSLSSVPLLALVRNEDEVQRMMALEGGADDVLTKPLNPLEILAKVNAVLRGRGRDMHESNLYRFGSVTIEFNWGEVTAEGIRISLTPTEYRVLHALVSARGALVTKQALARVIWNTEELSAGRDEEIRKYVYHLRSKLSKAGSRRTRVVNTRAYGYRFEVV